jgi:cytochrome c biogenesis protein CcmG/thiol:disulfide interchange protein DsbE
LKLRTGLITGGAAVAAAVLMFSLGWGLQHAALTSPQVLGRAAPALEIERPSGYVVDLSSYRGRPVVLNFWASWCGPCAQELPVLRAAFERYPGVAFVGADMNDTIQGYTEFEVAHPHPYATGTIVAGSYQAYGVVGPPTTFFINSDNVVVASFSGPLDAQTLDHYVALIKS